MGIYIVIGAILIFVAVLIVIFLLNKKCVFKNKCLDSNNKCINIPTGFIKKNYSCVPIPIKPSRRTRSLTTIPPTDTLSTDTPPMTLPPMILPPSTSSAFSQEDKKLELQFLLNKYNIVKNNNPQEEEKNQISFIIDLFYNEMPKIDSDTKEIINLSVKYISDDYLKQNKTEYFDKINNINIKLDDNIKNDKLNDIIYIYLLMLDATNNELLYRKNNNIIITDETLGNNKYIADMLEKYLYFKNLSSENMTNKLNNSSLIEEKNLTTNLINNIQPLLLTDTKLNNIKNLLLQKLNLYLTLINNKILNTQVEGFTVLENFTTF